jgi:hypothetical protein
MVQLQCHPVIELLVACILDGVYAEERIKEWPALQSRLRRLGIDLRVLARAAGN